MDGGIFVMGRGIFWWVGEFLVVGGGILLVGGGILMTGRGI